MKTRNLLKVVPVIIAALFMSDIAPAQTVAELKAVIAKTECPWFMSNDSNVYQAHLQERRDIYNTFPNLSKEELDQMREMINTRLDAILPLLMARDNEYTLYGEIENLKKFLTDAARCNNSCGYLEEPQFEGQYPHRTATAKGYKDMEEIRKHKDGKWRFTKNAYAGDLGNEEYKVEWLSDAQIERKKADVKRYENLIYLMDGMRLPQMYPSYMISDMRECWDMIPVARASMEIVSEAISNNSMDILKDNVTWKPMPKGGKMHATYAAQALAAAKKREGSGVIQVVIESDQWNIDRNEYGAILRRRVYGWFIKQNELGKYALPGSWAQDYTGNGYGALYMYSNGTANSFYIK